MTHRTPFTIGGLFTFMPSLLEKRGVGLGSSWGPPTAVPSFWQ